MPKSKNFPTRGQQYTAMHGVGVYCEYFGEY